MTQDNKTEKEKFFEWYEKEKKEKGLLYVKPITLDGTVPSGTTEEDVYRAMNAMNKAIEEGRTTIATDL